MDIVSILAAFGGGVFGSLIGGTTAFVFTGLMGLAGIVVLLSGGGDAILNNIAFGNVFLGALFGVIAFLVGEFILRTFSSYADTHIDMPAFTIAVLSFLILGILS